MINALISLQIDTACEVITVMNMSLMMEFTNSRSATWADGGVLRPAGAGGRKIKRGWHKAAHSTFIGEIIQCQQSCLLSEKKQCGTIDCLNLANTKAKMASMIQKVDRSKGKLKRHLRCHNVPLQ